MTASLLHIEHGDQHAVLLEELRVLVAPDGSGFYAHGLEIDYFTCGETAADAMHRFSQGLGLTIAAHIQKFGNIDRLLKCARDEIFKEYEATADSHELKLLTFHDTELRPAAMPETIVFSVPRLAA